MRRTPSTCTPTSHRAGPSTLRSERGAAMVEFALVLPVLLLILMAVLIVGQAFNESIDETHLVDIGARYAAVNQNPSGSLSLQAYIKSQAATSDLQGAQVCISFPNGTANAGDPVQVTISSVYNWIPLLSQYAFGGATSTTLTRTATMRIEVAPGTSPAYTAGCV